MTKQPSRAGDARFPWIDLRRSRNDGDATEVSCPLSSAPGMTEAGRSRSHERRRHLPENDLSVNGEVSSGDNRGSRILMKPKPVCS